MKQTQPPQADVLIAEDDRTAREKCAEILSGAGFSCEAVENGLQALQRCLQFRYRLLLTDLEMPSLHGWGLIARVRATPALHEMPIVTMTGHRERELVAKVVGMGVQAFLLKPFDPPTLVETVEHLLRPKTQAPPFAKCPKCGLVWPDLGAFMKDEAVNPIGFHAVLRDPMSGRIFFAHEGCGAELTILVESLVASAPQDLPKNRDQRLIHGCLPHEAVRESPILQEILAQMLSWR